MKQYHDVVREVLEKGTRKENRTGVDTISTFNINYEIDLQEGFPLLTTKEISWKNIVIENLWFLSGAKDISFLKKHKCKFWDPWANENGEVPSAYGNFWRRFPIHPNGETDSKELHYNDQISWLVDELKNNPTSRRLVVTAWAPGNAQFSKLPPCHAFWVCNVQKINEEDRLCLHLTQRSCDVALGVPYNIAGYSFINHVLCHLTGLKPGIFAHTLVDAHIYTSKQDGSMREYDHIPGLKEQLNRSSTKLPTLSISESIKTLSDIEDLVTNNVSTDEILEIFKLENYNPHPFIYFKVAV